MPEDRIELKIDKQELLMIMRAMEFYAERSPWHMSRRMADKEEQEHGKKLRNLRDRLAVLHEIYV